MPAAYDDLVTRVRRARDRTDVAVLEGFHALKHAIRFQAELQLVITPDRERIVRLATLVAPDISLPVSTVEVDTQRWRAIIGNRVPSSPIMAIARRPPAQLADLVAGQGPIVVLEAPRHLGNVGAVIRVAAAVGAAAVITVGDSDPWHPDAIRGAAGLQFAVPTVNVASIDQLGAALASTTQTRTVVGLDPQGTPLMSATLPNNTVVVFGTERAGLSPEAIALTDHLVAIPMRPGVSSLNLATAAAVTLYTMTTAR